MWFVMSNFSNNEYFWHIRDEQIFSAKMKTNLPSTEEELDK